MTLLHKTGDIHGCNYSHSPSIKHHLRPLDSDTRSHSVIRHVRVDNVESDVGKSDYSSYICDFLLPSSKYQRKD
jgi:hypothetical protein